MSLQGLMLRCEIEECSLQRQMPLDWYVPAWLNEVDALSEKEIYSSAVFCSFDRGAQVSRILGWLIDWSPLGQVNKLFAPYRCIRSISTIIESPFTAGVGHFLPFSSFNWDLNALTVYGEVHEHGPTQRRRGGCGSTSALQNSFISIVTDTKKIISWTRVSVAFICHPLESSPAFSRSFLSTRAEHRGPSTVGIGRL